MISVIVIVERSFLTAWKFFLSLLTDLKPITSYSLSEYTCCITHTYLNSTYLRLPDMNFDKTYLPTQRFSGFTSIYSVISVSSLADLFRFSALSFWKEDSLVLWRALTLFPEITFRLVHLCLVVLGSALNRFS